MDIKSMFPRASKSFLDINSAILTPKPNQNVVQRRTGALNEATDSRQIPNPKPKCDQKTALGSTVQGKAESIHRVVVRFTGFRVRPLDPDNFAGGCKDLLDGLRHSGIIKGDEPWRIIFETAQEKVKTYKEEKTLIEIEL